MTTSVMLRGLTLGLVMSFAAVAASADGKNWDAEKANQIDINRNSDAGMGNGGERVPKQGPDAGTWQPTWYGEDGPDDMDPGGSQDMNQACGDTTVSFATTDC